VDIFETLSKLGYGELHFGHDAATGLRALVGIHSTRLGPAIGGSRIRFYDTEADAIDDVTRLAQGMAYKAAIARLPHGGGKAVIMAPADLGKSPADKRAARFRAFGSFVDNLGGRYITTEDSGTSTSDMDVGRTATKHVLGTSIEKGGSGDPSPFTALGCRRGIEAVANHVFGKPDLKGLHVAVQGVGHVGYHLAKELHAQSAKLTVADVDKLKSERCAREFGAAVVAIDEIPKVDCEVFAPCALGAGLNDDTIPHLRARIVAGAANNQLAETRHGDDLYARGILYAPDYAINAGGLVNVAQEVKGYDPKVARENTMKIYDTIFDICERSKRLAAPTYKVADIMVEEKLAAVAHN